MKQQWAKMCEDLMFRPADQWASNRKILNNVVWTMRRIKGDLTLEDGGYTSKKLNDLKKFYLVQDSIDAVVPIWEGRSTKQMKYGSISFTCCGHSLKSDPNKGSKRASKLTPCIQSMSLTYNQNHSIEAHAFYRTTELFKKFPADLVFIRDVLLPNFGDMPDKLTFMFANATIHPMYFGVAMMSMKDPLAILERLQEEDKKFFDYVIKATSRYLLPEHERGIQKHMQSMSVYRDVNKRIPDKLRDNLVPFLRKHHTGFRN